MSWLATHPWVYPTFEVTHIVGIALLLGNLLLVELRVWGAGAELPLQPLARLALRVALAGFWLALASGLAMLFGHWGDISTSRIFLVKMGLLTLAGANALLFHNRGSLLLLDRTARVQTVLSVALWLAVVACGRAITYV